MKKKSKWKCDKTSQPVSINMIWYFQLNRLPGRLLLVSGATGKSLGLYLEMPRNKETYMSPVLHTRKDGSHYILMGSGGQAASGIILKNVE